MNQLTDTAMSTRRGGNGGGHRDGYSDGYSDGYDSGHGGSASREMQPGQRRDPGASGQGAEARRAAVPPVAILEDQGGITVLADMPGVPRENLAVRVDGEDLVLEGTVSVRMPDRMELIYGEAQIPAYRRRFTLSRELDASRIEATMKDGVLQLRIPKAEDAKPRRIEVKAG